MLGKEDLGDCQRASEEKEGATQEAGVLLGSGELEGWKCPHLLMGGEIAM